MGHGTALPPDDWRLTVYGRTRITGTDRRRPAPAAVRRALELQGDVCLYCQIPIGTEILRGNRLVRLRRHYDHFVPYVYEMRNPGLNWAIACHVCNRIKNANVFATIEEARTYVLPRRETAGYEPDWAVRRRINLTGAP